MTNYEFYSMQLDLDRDIQKARALHYALMSCDSIGAVNRIMQMNNAFIQDNPDIFDTAMMVKTRIRLVHQEMAKSWHLNLN
jgi:hypothetical protein